MSVRDTEWTTFDGGHDLVYPFIPKDGQGSIWLDAMMDPREWPFNLYHEAHEREEMAQGMSYGKAHTNANAVEKKLREREGFFDPVDTRDAVRTCETCDAELSPREKTCRNCGPRTDTGGP